MCAVVQFLEVCFHAFSKLSPHASIAMLEHVHVPYDVYGTWAWLFNVPP
jgi:hypothetical protein